MGVHLRRCEHCIRESIIIHKRCACITIRPYPCSHNPRNPHPVFMPRSMLQYNWGRNSCLQEVQQQFLHLLASHGHIITMPSRPLTLLQIKTDPCLLWDSHVMSLMQWSQTTFSPPFLTQGHLCRSPWASTWRLRKTKGKENSVPVSNLNHRDCKYDW